MLSKAQYSPIENQEIDKQFLSKLLHEHSSDIAYKTLRCYYDAKYISHYDMQNALKQLLKHQNLSSSLQAKIYFQLIRLNLELAAETNQAIYLLNAIHYCEKLQHPHFNNTTKAKEADRIKTKLLFGIKQFAPANLSSQVTSAVEFLPFVLKKVFKYIGIFIGNILDLSLLLQPKIMSKRSIWFGQEYDQDGNRINTNKPPIHPRSPEKQYTDHFQHPESERVSFVADYLKNAGIASVTKWIGKRVGAGLGYLLSPITALVGLGIFGIRDLHFKYADNKKVSELTNETKQLQKEVATQSDTSISSTATVTKTIFEHKKDPHHYYDTQKQLITVDSQKLQEKKVVWFGKKNSTVFANNTYGSSQVSSQVPEEPYNSRFEV